MIIQCLLFGLLTHAIIHLSTGLDWKSITTSYLAGCIDWNCNIPGKGVIYHIQHWSSQTKFSAWNPEKTPLTKELIFMTAIFRLIVFQFYNFLLYSRITASIKNVAKWKFTLRKVLDNNLEFPNSEFQETHFLAFYLFTSLLL